MTSSWDVHTWLVFDSEKYIKCVVIKYYRIQYTDVIMGAMASQITSLNIVYLTVYSAQIKENIKVPCHWPLCGAFTGDRWIPRTNGQKHGKRFHFNDVFMHQRSPNDACCASGEELLTTNSIKPQLHSCDSSHSRDKMAAILADDIFKWIFLNDNDRFKFYWNLFPGVQLTINDPGNALAPNRWQAIIWTKLTRFLDAYMRHQGWGWGLGWGLVDWGGWGGKPLSEQRWPDSLTHICGTRGGGGGWGGGWLIGVGGVAVGWGWGFWGEF